MLHVFIYKWTFSICCLKYLCLRNVLAFLLNVKYKNIQCTRSGQVVRIDLEPVFALTHLPEAQDK
jgi:hypothetical protein